MLPSMRACGVRQRTGQLAPAERASRASVQAAAALAGPPDQVGRWGAPFSIPVVAVHAAMLPTGKVMWFSYRKNPAPAGGGEAPRSPNTAQAWLWDPATGATKRVDPPLWRDPADGVLKPANIWCAGQTFTADGRLVVFGGNLRFSDPDAPAGSRTSRASTRSTPSTPGTRAGPSSPTCATDAGIRPRPGWRTGESWSSTDSTKAAQAFERNPDVELFTPSADLNGRGTVSLLGTLPATGDVRVGGLYPHMFAMPSGRTMVAGPFPEDTWFLNPPGPSNSFTWQDYPNMPTDAALGHRGADAGRHGRLDPGHATRRLHHHLHPLGGHDPDLRRGKPGGGLAGKAVDAGPARPPQHRAACPTARWSQSAAASA